MSEIIEAIKILAQWPVAEGFFIIVIAFLGIMTYRRAEHDRKSLGSGTIEIPLYLLNGPLADAIDSVHKIAELTEQNNKLLEEIRNYQIMYGGTAIGPKAPRGR